MKRFYTLNTVLLTILIFCSCDKECLKVTKNNIKVYPMNSLFKTEHIKYISILNNSQEEVDFVKLRQNVDYRCNSVLFENDKYFVITECDGRFYKIDKICASFCLMNENEFNFNDYKYIGIYKFSHKSNKYEFYNDLISKSLIGNEIFRFGGSWEKKF
jgi:hypothetical protein